MEHISIWGNEGETRSFIPNALRHKTGFLSGQMRVPHYGLPLSALPECNLIG